MPQERGESVTVFRFVCQHCGSANEYAHRHRLGVTPYLITRACQSCLFINELDGLVGVDLGASEVEPPPSDPPAQAPIR